MSRTLGLLTAAALLSSAAAFAQSTSTQTPPSSAPSSATESGSTAAPAAKSSASEATAPAAKSGTSEATAPAASKHRHHARRGSTDNIADQLNACMAGGGSPADREQCVRQAENSARP